MGTDNHKRNSLGATNKQLPLSHAEEKVRQKQRERIRTIRWLLGIVLFTILGLNFYLKWRNPNEYGIFGSLDLPSLLAQYGVPTVLLLMLAIPIYLYIGRRQHGTHSIEQIDDKDLPLTVMATDRAISEQLLWLLLLFIGSLFFGAIVRHDEVVWFIITLTAPFLTMLLLLYQIVTFLGHIDRLVIEEDRIIVERLGSVGKVYDYDELQRVYPLKDKLYLGFSDNQSLMIDTLYFHLTVDGLRRYLERKIGVVKH